MSIRRTTFIGFGIAVFAGALWVHWPSLQGTFLRVDDVEYLRQAQHWNGLTWNAVKWAFTSTESYYQPLTRLSHVLDYQIWGMNAAGHHATSVILHAVNAVLVFGLLWTLLGPTSLTKCERLMLAWGVALAFAVHPLQTESVAWMAGRTQLLCTTFLLCGLWTYAANQRQSRVWGWYLAALLCKPMAVSLPFVMLAIDYYPLQRHVRIGWRRLVWEKVPMMAMASAVGVATIITKARDGRMPWPPSSFSVDVFRVFESLAFYLWKLAWPTHLSPTYPIPWGLSLGQAPVLASVLVIVIISLVAVRERRRLPMLLAAWSAYVVLILPVSGVMSPVAQALAQRYAYLAMVPLLLLVGGAIVMLLRHLTKTVTGVVAFVLVGQLCVFAADTRRLIPDWHNDESLWRATLVELPDSEAANRALATELCDQGRVPEALPYAQRAVEIAPQRWEAHMRLGLVLAMVGRPQEAIEQHEEALRINPRSAMAQFGLAVALVQIGKPEEAIGRYEEALRLDPSLDGAHYNLANALLQLGRPQEAIDHYRQALGIQQALQIRTQPDSAGVLLNWGIALFRMGKAQEAIDRYQQALKIKPDFAEAENNLGFALVQLGRVGEAIEHYRRALSIKPDFAEAQFNLKNTLESTGQLQETVNH